MTEQDPPILISDEWLQRNQNRQAVRDPDDLDGEQPELLPPAAPVAEALPEAEPLDVEAGHPLSDSSVSDDEPTSDPLTAIEAELRTLRAETVHVNQILDRLHAENERLRRKESEQLLMPLFRDLMKLADDWTAMGASWERKESATAADVAQRCHDVADDARLILARHGVEILAPAVGDPIERKQHRVVGTAEAETPELDNTVADVRRPGFLYGDKVLKFAEVVAARRGR